MHAPRRSLKIVVSAMLGGAVGSALTGCSIFDDPTPAERQLLHDAEVGRQIAQRQCLACHRLEGPSTPDAPPTLTEVARRYHDARIDWELETISQVGHYRMPRKTLTSEEISALAAYIRSLDSAQPEPDVRGRPR